LGVVVECRGGHHPAEGGGRYRCDRCVHLEANDRCTYFRL
jgi:hypothetical protein